MLAGTTVPGFPSLLHSSSQLRSAGDKNDGALKVKLRASDGLIKSFIKMV